MRAWTIAALLAAGLGWLGEAQSKSATMFGPPPTTPAAVGAWDAKIVARAAALIPSADQWNRKDVADNCPRRATTFSIACALDRAVGEAAGLDDGQTPVPLGRVGSPTHQQCAFHSVIAGQEGGCGTLFDEVPILTMARAKTAATGVWRKDKQPTDVWVGTMVDAESPVNTEADRLADVMAKKRSSLTAYNNDPSTTFADVQAFFKTLGERVVTNAVADMGSGGDDVEVEFYAGGTGVIRTYEGWFAVDHTSNANGSPQFSIDLTDEVPPNDLDKQIIQRAAALITSDAVWNRADNRKCPEGAKTISIYCAEERASIEVTGGFDHRRPALEIVRVIVEDRTKGKKYDHRLMDYNNDPSTTLADVQSLFAEALARIKWHPAEAGFDIPVSNSSRSHEERDRHADRYLEPDLGVLG